MATTKTKKKTAAPTINIVMSKFDSAAGATQFSVLRECAIDKWEPLSVSDYRPRGGTPLRDATALFLAKIDEQAGAGKVVVGLLADESGSMGGNQRAVVDGLNEFIGGLEDIGDGVDEKTDGKVIAVIFTDGGENASTEVGVEQLADMITEREARGWTFIYMGANQDAWGVGGGIGLSGGAGGQSVNFVSTDKGTRSGLRSAGMHTASYLANNDSYVAAASASPMRSLSEDGSGDVDLTATSKKGKGKKS